jgi:uncharacterized protein (TIGR02265 family)
MELRGLVIQNRKKFVEDSFGKDAWQKVLDNLSEADREAIGELILAAKWYPFELGERIDRTIVNVLGGGKERIFEDIGAKSARQSLTKLHSSFLTPGDPQAFMKKLDIMYKFYYDTGRRDYTQTGPTSGIMTTYDAKTFSATDCLTVIGYHKEALRMCGARNVEAVEEECRAKGGSCCRYRFSWDM